MLLGQRREAVGDQSDPLKADPVLRQAHEHRPAGTRMQQARPRDDDMRPIVIPSNPLSDTVSPLTRWQAEPRRDLDDHRRSIVGHGGRCSQPPPVMPSVVSPSAQSTSAQRNRSVSHPSATP